MSREVEAPGGRVKFLGMLPCTTRAVMRALRFADSHCAASARSWLNASEARRRPSSARAAVSWARRETFSVASSSAVLWAKEEEGEASGAGEEPTAAEEEEEEEELLEAAGEGELAEEEEEEEDEDEAAVAVSVGLLFIIVSLAEE